MAFIDPRQANLVPNTDLFTRVLTSLAGNKIQQDRQNQYQEQQTQQAKGNKSAALFAMRLAGLPMADKKAPLQEMARQMAKSGRDTSEIMSLINMQDEDELNLALERLAMDSDPDTYASMTKKQPEGLASAVSKVFKNGTIIQTLPDKTDIVKDQSGRTVTGEERVRVLRKAYEDEISNLKSPEEVQQIVDLTRMKAEAGRDQQKRQLEMQSLVSQIEQGKLKLAEGQKQKTKSSNLKNEALRIVNNLLDNQQGVKAVVGPVDSWIPTVYPSSLKATTDINQLRSILTAENLGLMSGVLSESDIKIIAGIAGGGLDMGGDHSRFIEELSRMKQTLMNDISQQTSNPVPATKQTSSNQDNDPLGIR